MGTTRTVKYYPSRVKAELKKYGKAYVQKKYGLAVYAKVTGQSLKKTSKGYVISKATGAKLDYVHKSKTSGRSIYAKDEDHSLHSHMLGHNDKHVAGKGGIGNKGLIKTVGNAVAAARTGRSEKSKLNAPPKPKPGWDGPGPLHSFVEGGMADLAQGKVPFQRQMNFNLSNDSDLAQGSEHPWAQATSISHLISGQLRLASNQTVDAWEQWAQDKSGTTDITRRNGSPFGVDMNFTPDFGEQVADPHAGHDHMEAEEAPSMGAGTQLAQSNPMGAFGTSSVMYDLGEAPDEIEEQVDEDGSYGGWYTPEQKYGASSYTGQIKLALKADEDDWKKYDAKGYAAAVKAAEAAASTGYQDWARTEGANGYQTIEGDAAGNAARWNEYSAKGQTARNTAYNKELQKQYALFYNKYTSEKFGERENMLDPTGTKWIPNPNFKKDPTGPGTEGEPYKQTPLPNYNTGEGGDAFKLPDNFTPTSDVYNPWAYGEGGEYNMMGPSSARMGQATMEAMALANAYFAPQRAELAYELGDMETDMRRLASNLGRQVDDPVLQAKLYKEASRAVRTLDIQQNTYAFQMADARRKEELNNWQFYDQLAQNEHQMRLANYQYMKTLDLQYSQYNLQNWQAQYAANQGLPGQTTPPTGGTTENMEDYDYGSAKSVTGSKGSGSGIYSKTRY